MAFNQFDGFAQPHADRIEIAVVDVMAADSILAAFAPIVRPPTPILDPEEEKPVVWVSVPDMTPRFEMQREVEIDTTIRIVCAFEERRPFLEPGEISAKAWVAQVWKVLFANDLLQVPRYGGDRLVDRILEFATLETGRQAPGDRGGGELEEDEEPEEGIFYWLTIDVVFQWDASLDTLEPPT